MLMHEIFKFWTRFNLPPPPTPTPLLSMEKAAPQNRYVTQQESVLWGGGRGRGRLLIHGIAHAWKLEPIAYVIYMNRKFPKFSTKKWLFTDFPSNQI